MRINGDLVVRLEANLPAQEMDEMFAQLARESETTSWEPIQSMVSVNLNLGGDEVPGHGNGGLVWCGEVAQGQAPRWVPAPMAIIFRISNHSWHAVTPGRREPTGVRLTLQIVYAGKVARAGAPRAMGYDLGQRLPQIFEGCGESPETPTLSGASSWEDQKCHDMLPTKDHNCELMFLSARSSLDGCSKDALWQSAPWWKCCSDWLVVEVVRRQAARVVTKSTLRRLSSGRWMPLLAFGTGGLSGQRASDVISYALKTGYRHLDSAASYPSFPDALVSGFLQSGVPREEVFLSTKVPTSTMGYDATRRLLERMKDELPGNYADLCMVHWPDSAVAPPENVDPKWWLSLERVGTWKALEEAYDRGICRYTPMAPLLDVLAFCDQHDVAISAFAWNRPRELHDLAKSLLPEKDLSRELVMKVLMRWFMAQGMTPLFRSSREEVILDMALGVREIPQLTQGAIDSLRKPISDYPWEYYDGERPWNAAVIAYDSNMMSFVLSTLLPPSPLRVGVQEKLRALSVFPVEVVDAMTAGFNLSAWYLVLTGLWAAFFLYVTIEAIALSSLMQYGLLGLGVHYGLDQWDEELNRTAIRRKVQSGIRSKFMDDAQLPLSQGSHVGQLPPYGTVHGYGPAYSSYLKERTVDYSMPSTRYEVEMDEEEDEAEVVRQLAEKLSQEESPEALLDRAFFE
eukprot:s1718_g6.t1